jgi:hypothetical protein
LIKPARKASSYGKNKTGRKSVASPKVWQPLFLKTKKILINTMQKGWQIESVAIQIKFASFFSNIYLPFNI